MSSLLPPGKSVLPHSETNNVSPVNIISSFTMKQTESGLCQGVCTVSIVKPPILKVSLSFIYWSTVNVANSCAIIFAPVSLTISRFDDI